jgi:IS5 family transposase
VTADRGYGDVGVEDELRELGVRYPAIPAKGKPNATRRHVRPRQLQP